MASNPLDDRKRNFCPECQTRRRTLEGQKHCRVCDEPLHTEDCPNVSDLGAPCTCGSAPKRFGGGR